MSGHPIFTNITALCTKIIIPRSGLSFDLKLVDMFQSGRASPDNIREDVFTLVRLLYNAIGGPRANPSTLRK
ncbi:MAG: hypothetical protein ACYTG0_09860 [Planctomycetota bacterium]